MPATTKTEPKTPTLDLLAENKERRDAILDFLEWLQAEHRVELAKYHQHAPTCYEKRGVLICGKVMHEHTDKCRSKTDFEDVRVCGCGEETLYSFHTKHDRLVMQYLGIDEKQVEVERRALLDQLTASMNTTEGT